MLSEEMEHSQYPTPEECLQASIKFIQLSLDVDQQAGEVLTFKERFAQLERLIYHIALLRARYWKRFNRTDEQLTEMLAHLAKSHAGSEADEKDTRDYLDQAEEILLKLRDAQGRNEQQ